MVVEKEICSTCGVDINQEEEGGIVGCFGILPIAFCVTCLPSLIDMVIHIQGYDDIDTLKERIQDLKEDFD